MRIKQSSCLDIPAFARLDTFVLLFMTIETLKQDFGTSINNERSL
ncbi:hypothetical protein MCHI_003574 [Candidatus Magnetoovum chiemensis]|nr:hypothetical protein MCHI_003574 [Candidatus Magnetoovum chiemensis]